MNGEFALSQSQRADEELAALLAFLQRQGNWKLTSLALKWTLEELTRTPMRFGESRGDLSDLELHMRVGLVEPFRVDYAVHLPSHQVFIQHWGLNQPK
jgi:hypothetical protein